MILYLALRGCSKAAIAFALRSEVLRPADIRVADWESVAEGSIKAELEAMVVESPQEPLQDADAIISRVVGYAEAEYWQTSILAQATKYMAAAREVGEQNGRATIVKKMAENAKARILRRKERYRDVAETFNTMAAGIDIRLAQRYQEKIEARYPRTPMDWMPCSEENMATNLFLLQYTGLLINQLLEKW